MADTPNFTKLVPGFDFLQTLVKSAGSALPNMGQWVAPTLDPEELEKRINELRTVQFWLEQNAKMLGATIQALEVQRMTLSTLKTMNVQMGDLRDSLTIKTPAAAPASSGASSAWPARQGEAKTAGAQAPASGAHAIDPVQWWTALTKQFTELAASAMKEGAGQAADTMAAMRSAAAPEAAAEPSKTPSEANGESDAAQGDAAKAARKAAARKQPR